MCVCVGGLLMIMLVSGQCLPSKLMMGIEVQILSSEMLVYDKESGENGLQNF